MNNVKFIRASGGVAAGITLLATVGMSSILTSPAHAVNFDKYSRYMGYAGGYPVYCYQNSNSCIQKRSVRRNDGYGSCLFAYTRKGERYWHDSRWDRKPGEWKYRITGAWVNYVADCRIR